MEHAEAPQRHTRFQFDRLEAWQRDAVVRKQREQAELRATLAEQVRAKKERQLRDRQSLDEEEERARRTPRDRTSLPAVGLGLPGHGNNQQREAAAESPLVSHLQLPQEREQQGHSSTQQQEQQEQQQETPQERQRAHDDREKFGEGFSKLFAWQQDAIVAKRRDQERNRRALEEQIQAKKERKRREAAVVEAEDAAREAVNSDQQQHQPGFAASLPTSRSQASGPVASPVPLAATAGPPQRAPVDDEINALREQVEEQKRLLQEQAALMQNLQRQTEQQQEQRASQVSDASDEHKMPSARSRKGGAKAAVPRGEGRGKRPRRPPRRGKPASSNTAALLPALRQVSLRRNEAGKLGVEAEALGRYCVIKRAAKSFVNDDRAILRPSDLVVALGQFSARRALRQGAADELPTFEQVTHMLAKGGAIVTLAVEQCSPAKLASLAAEEDDNSAEEEEEEQQQQQQQYDTASPRSFQEEQNRQQPPRRQQARPHRHEHSPQPRSRPAHPSPARAPHPLDANFHHDGGDEPEQDNADDDAHSEGSLHGSSRLVSLDAGATPHLHAGLEDDLDLDCR